MVRHAWNELGSTRTRNLLAGTTTTTNVVATLEALRFIAMIMVLESDAYLSGQVFFCHLMEDCREGSAQLRWEWLCLLVFFYVVVSLALQHSSTLLLSLLQVEQETLSSTCS